MANVRDIYMNDLHKAAQLFYESQTEEGKESLDAFIANLDADGNGKVGLLEIKRSLKSTDEEAVADLFGLLDVDRSQNLETDECKTFYYLLSTKTTCKVCSRNILANGFTCMQCLSNQENYTMCLDCYKKDILHPHTDFVDDNIMFALLSTPEFMNVGKMRLSLSSKNNTTATSPCDENHAAKSMEDLVVGHSGEDNLLVEEEDSKLEEHGVAICEGRSLSKKSSSGTRLFAHLLEGTVKGALKGAAKGAAKGTKRIVREVSSGVNNVSSGISNMVSEYL